jgi:hypothetical protein
MRLESTGTATRVVEVGQPTHCANGHPLGPYEVVVGFLPCLCVWPERGHRSFVCRRCGDISYVPPHGPAYESRGEVRRS